MSQPSPLASPLAWDLVAEAYDAELRDRQFEPLARQALRAIDVQGRDVLDVATGPGTLALLAAREGARVTAIDFAPEMIARARKNAKDAGVAIDARVGDAMALPFADGSYDAAFAMFVVMFLPDRAKGMTELRRVLRPGGRAAVASWPPMNRSPLLGAMFEAVSALVPGMPPNDGKAPLGTTEEMAEALRSAGFVDVEAREIAHEIDVPSTTAFWEVAQRTTAPLVLLSKRLGPVGWAGIASGVADALEARFGAGPQKLPIVANLGLGTRPS